MKLLSRIKRKLKNEAGQALPMALILLLLGGFLVVPTLALMSSSLTANRVVDQANLRVYAADAGIQYAYNKFLNDADFNPDTDPLDFESDVNGCDVSLNVEPGGEDFTYKVTSIATDLTDPDKSTTIVAYFLADAAQYEAGSSPFDYAVATLDGNLTMTGSARITSDCSPEPCSEGDVWVNGDIILGWSNIIEGDAAATGTCNRPGNIEGTYTPGSDPIERPTWLDDQINDYIDSTDVADPGCSGSWDTVYTGNKTLGWSDPYTFGSVHVTGNLTISGTNNGGVYTFNGPVCVDGNLTISSGPNFVTFKGPVRVGGDGYLNLQGTGWVKFENPDPEQTTITYAYHGIAPSYSLQGLTTNISGYSATVTLTAGDFGPGGAVDVKLQDSNDGSIWTDVPGGSFPQVTEIHDNTYIKNYNRAKSYLRAVATVSGATCQFGVTAEQQTTTLYIGKYLEVGGSRSAQFKGPVVVNGAALKSSTYIVYIGGAKYSGVAWDMQFYSTLRATEPVPNCSHKIYFGGSKIFQFYDVVYTNVSAELAGATGSNMTFTKAFIADCNITVSGSSIVDAPPTTSPLFVSRNGNIDLSGATLVDAIVYAPGEWDGLPYREDAGNVHVSGSSQLEGAIVAESALLEGAIKLKYPVVLRERDDLEPGEGEGGGGEEGESAFSMVSYSIQ